MRMGGHFICIHNVLTAFWCTHTHIAWGIAYLFWTPHILVHIWNSHKPRLFIYSKRRDRVDMLFIPSCGHACGCCWLFVIDIDFFFRVMHIFAHTHRQTRVHELARGSCICIVCVVRERSPNNNTLSFAHMRKCDERGNRAHACIYIFHNAFGNENIGSNPVGYFYTRNWIFNKSLVDF